MLADSTDQQRERVLDKPANERHGSVKRVASAVGEGAIAVQLVHQYLAEAELTAV